jgi:hypothetical protein
MITVMCVICIFSGPVVFCVSDSDLNVVRISTLGQGMMASLIEHLLNTVINSEEGNFPFDLGEESEEEFERAAEEFLQVPSESLSCHANSKVSRD